MRKRESSLPVFFVLLFFSAAVLFLAKNSSFLNIRFFAEKNLPPLQAIAFDFFNLPKNLFKDSKVIKLEKENQDLLKKLLDRQKILDENNALKDQFKTVYPARNKLLPAKIIGFYGEKLILDKGSKDNIKTGQAVVFKDNLLGKIGAVSQSLSRVDLISSPNSSFMVKIRSKDDLSAQTQGIIKGQGNGDMIIDNVLLSESLGDSDIVLAKGDLDINGLGYPSDLIVGKVGSVDKKSSDLYQKGRVKPLLDFAGLSSVFIMVEY